MYNFVKKHNGDCETMKKRISLKRIRSVLIVAALLVDVAVMAQTQRDVVYMKNGSVIRGQVTNNSDEKVVVETDDGNVFVYKKSDINKMVKEATGKGGEERSVVKPIRIAGDLKEDTYDPAASNGRWPTKGWRGFVGGCFGLALDDVFEHRAVCTFYTSHGFQFNHALYLGLGLQSEGMGVERYVSSNETEVVSLNMLTLFLDGRVDFLKKAVSPFLDCRVGHGWNNLEGGYFALMAGVRVKRHNMAMGIERISTKVDEYSFTYGRWKSCDEVLSAFYFSYSYEFGRR